MPEEKDEWQCDPSSQKACPSKEVGRKWYCLVIPRRERCAKRAQRQQVWAGRRSVHARNRRVAVRATRHQSTGPVWSTQRGMVGPAAHCDRATGRRKGWGKSSIQRPKSIPRRAAQRAGAGCDAVQQARAAARCWYRGRGVEWRRTRWHQQRRRARRRGARVDGKMGRHVGAPARDEQQCARCVAARAQRLARLSRGGWRRRGGAVPPREQQPRRVTRRRRGGVACGAAQTRRVTPPRP